jgi:uncharacterized protein
MGEEKTGIELLDLAAPAKFPYDYSCGKVGSFFFKALRDEKKIYGRKCAKCGKVYIPPRPVCGPCYAPTKEWVEVGPQGTLECFTVVHFSFLDPLTGKKRPVPYGYGLIRLDHADSRIQHFLSVNEEAKLKVGMRMEAVFNDDREGKLSDIKWFKPVE